VQDVWDKYRKEAPSFCFGLFMKKWFRQSKFSMWSWNAMVMSLRTVLKVK